MKKQKKKVSCLKEESNKSENIRKKGLNVKVCGRGRGEGCARHGYLTTVYTVHFPDHLLCSDGNILANYSQNGAVSHNMTEKNNHFRINEFATLHT